MNGRLVVFYGDGALLKRGSVDLSVFIHQRCTACVFGLPRYRSKTTHNTTHRRKVLMHPVALLHINFKPYNRVWGEYKHQKYSLSRFFLPKKNCEWKSYFDFLFWLQHVRVIILLLPFFFSRVFFNRLHSGLCPPGLQITKWNKRMLNC